eukprot:610239-Amphidinium_carterae.1
MGGEILQVTPVLSVPSLLTLWMHCNAGVLRNYVAVCDAAVQLRKAESLKSFSDEELYRLLGKLGKERVAIPMKIKAKILERQCCLWVEKQSWAELASAILPFEKSIWSDTEPKVSALDADEPVMVSTFEELMSSTLLKPLIKKGESAKAEVASLVQTFREKMQSVDVLELSNQLASCLANASTVCNCIEALLAEQIMTSRQAPSGVADQKAHLD